MGGGSGGRSGLGSAGGDNWALVSRWIGEEMESIVRLAGISPMAMATEDSVGLFTEDDDDGFCLDGEGTSEHGEK